MLFRPPGEQETTVPTQNNHYRLSLLTGETVYTHHVFSLTTIEGSITDLLTIDDARTAHER